MPLGWNAKLTLRQQKQIATRPPSFHRDLRPRGNVAEAKVLRMPHQEGHLLDCSLVERRCREVCICWVSPWKLPLLTFTEVASEGSPNNAWNLYDSIYAVCLKLSITKSFAKSRIQIRWEDEMSWLHAALRVKVQIARWPNKLFIQLAAGMEKNIERMLWLQTFQSNKPTNIPNLCFKASWCFMSNNCPLVHWSVLKTFQSKKPVSTWQFDRFHSEIFRIGGHSHWPLRFLCLNSFKVPCHGNTKEIQTHRKTEEANESRLPHSTERLKSRSGLHTLTQATSNAWSRPWPQDIVLASSQVLSVSVWIISTRAWPWIWNFSSEVLQNLHQEVIAKSNMKDCSWENSQEIWRKKFHTTRDSFHWSTITRSLQCFGEFLILLWLCRVLNKLLYYTFTFNKCLLRTFLTTL